MKDYFSSRNEKLLKKLFESQKITVKEIGIPQMTAWQAHVPDETQRRRIEEDFKSALQENWLAAGNEALTNEELQAALESIISEKIDIENDKIAGKTIPAHAEGVPLVDDPKTGNKIANPSKEEEIENIIKQTLTNTNDKIQALGTFYQLLSKKENEANGDAVADSPEEEKEEIKDKVEDALEDDGSPLAPSDKDSKELNQDIGAVPLIKGDDSLAKLVKQAGADDALRRKIVLAVRDQLKASGVDLQERETPAAAAPGVVPTADSERLLQALTSNATIGKLMDKIDNVKEIVSFLSNVVDIIQTNPKVEPEMVIKAVMRLPGIEKYKARNSDNESGNAPAPVVSKGAFDRTGIQAMVGSQKGVSPEVKKNISKILKHWLGKYVANKNIKISEDVGTIISSVLENMVRIKEVHVTLTPDDEETLSEKAPPGFSEEEMQKLKKQYPGDEARAFATAWSIHNKNKK